MGRRGKAKGSATNDRSNGDQSPVTDPSDTEINFEPGKLSIVINGVSKPFSTWTKEYARHYYPHLGRRTYRVPPVDFNTQELRDITRLGFSELANQKEENRKKDRSQADVAFMLEELGKRLEKKPDGGGGLFIIANAHYDNYLSDLKGVKFEGKQPPLPKEVAARGEVDFLVLHPRKGISLIQVKGVGMKTDKWNPTEQQLHQAVRKKVTEAVDQVKRDHVVLDHVMKDLQLQCAVHRVVALPFVSQELLQQSFAGAEDGIGKCGPKFICMDDMVDNDAMLAWWEKLATDGSCKDLSDDQLQSIVGRYCGLLSTVQVWAKSSLRVEVRDVAEAANEVGSRFASIVLTPEQTASLDCQQQYVYLYGPPGSGKSVMLVVKSRQWILADSDVCILNLDFGKNGMPIGHYIHDSIQQWMVKSLLGGSRGGKGKKGQTTSGSTDGSCDGKDSGSSCTSNSSSASTATSASEESDHAVPTDMTEKEEGFAGHGNTTRPPLPQKETQSATNKPHTSRVFRIDFDLDTPMAIEELMKTIKSHIRPGIPCHFIWDEFYWKEKLKPVIEVIKREFPKSCIWCAEISSEGAPEDFTLMPLKTVIRCPPAVQAVLQRTDWVEENCTLYTVDSTQHGLPTDGLKPRLLEHKDHQAQSPLDCIECADLFIDFLRHDLKLSPQGTDTGFLSQKVKETEGLKQSDESSSLETKKPRLRNGTNGREKTVKEGPGLEITPEKRKGKRGKNKELSAEKVSEASELPVPKTKKRGHLLPHKVKYSDIVVLFAYPQKCINPGVSNLLLVRAQLQDLYHATIQNSVFFRRVVDAGVPATFLAPNADARDIALPAQDQVMFSVTNAVTGLERKVVVYIPCESAKYSEYPLDISQVPAQSNGSAGGERKADEASRQGEARSADRQEDDQSKETGDHGCQPGVHDEPERVEDNRVSASSLNLPTPDSPRVNDDVSETIPYVMNEKEDFANCVKAKETHRGNKAANKLEADAANGNLVQLQKPRGHRNIQSPVPSQKRSDACACFNNNCLNINAEGNSGSNGSHADAGRTKSQTDNKRQPSQVPLHLDFSSFNGILPSANHPGVSITQKSSGATDMIRNGTDLLAQEAKDTSVPSKSAQKWKAGLSEEDWAMINERMLAQNKRGTFYAASRCLSMFVLIVP